MTKFDWSILVLSAPIWVPALAILSIGLGALWCKRALIGPTNEWRPWFAWFPVTVGPWEEPGRCWLEWVERRAGHLLGDATYRLPGSEEAHPLTATDKTGA